MVRARARAGAGGHGAGDQQLRGGVSAPARYGRCRYLPRRSLQIPAAAFGADPTVETRSNTSRMPCLVVGTATAAPIARPIGQLLAFRSETRDPVGGGVHGSVNLPPSDSPQCSHLCQGVSSAVHIGQAASLSPPCRVTRR